MEFNWSDLLKFAYYTEALTIDIVSKEALLRSAINRAYYSIFIRARNNAGLEEETHKVHTKIIDHYTSLGNDDPLQIIGYRLKKLKSMRIVSDYHNTWDYSMSIEKATKKALILANSIENTLTSS